MKYKICNNYLLIAIRAVFHNELTHEITQTEAINPQSLSLKMKSLRPNWVPATENALTKLQMIRSAMLMLNIIMFSLFFLKLPEYIIANIVTILPINKQNARRVSIE